MSVVLCLPAHLRVSTAASRGQAPHGNASLYIYLYLYIEIRNKQVTPAKDLLGYHKRLPVNWKPLTSPYVWGRSGKNRRITETSSPFQNHHGVTTQYKIPYSKVLNGVRKGAGREHQKFVDTNVVPSGRSVKWYQEVRGGGCRSQVVKMRRTVKNEKDIEKKEKEGGRNSSPGDQSGAQTPKSLAELSFFSRWLF